MGPALGRVPHFICLSASVRIPFRAILSSYRTILVDTPSSARYSLTMTESNEAIGHSSSLLTSRPITRIARAFTKVRVLLAIPFLVALFYLVDRGPLWPGVLVALFGEFFQLWAAAHLHKEVRIICSGPYSHVRNPMYVGRFFVGLGFALLTWRWYLVVGYVLLFAFYAQARVLGEEQRLNKRFGADYLSYCGAVNRWFPKLANPHLSELHWSWQAVRRNHQLRVTLGVVVLLALLWWRVYYYR